MYGKQLGDFPGFPLLSLVESYAKGETVKQSKSLELCHLEAFIQKADDKNRYFLARKATAVIAYFGGNRMHEVRELTMDDVKPCDLGYSVKFKHAKQRRQIFKSQ